MNNINIVYPYYYESEHLVLNPPHTRKSSTVRVHYKQYDDTFSTMDLPEGDYEIYENGSIFSFGGDRSSSFTKIEFTGILKLYKYTVHGGKLVMKNLELKMEEGIVQ